MNPLFKKFDQIIDEFFSANRATSFDPMFPGRRERPKDAPYGCQQYGATRLCRFDRRAIDRKCDGCQRVTDREYLESQGLWIEGISHD